MLFVLYRAFAIAGSISSSDADISERRLRRMGRRSGFLT